MRRQFDSNKREKAEDHCEKLNQVKRKSRRKSKAETDEIEDFDGNSGTENCQQIYIEQDDNVETKDLK